VRAEFQQHVRAKLFADLRTLFVGGVPRDSKYAGLRSQMKECIEKVFDSGLADEAFSRAANSFQRRQTSAAEDGDPNASSDCIAKPATTTTESFRSRETPIPSLQTEPWSSSFPTAFEMPIHETLSSITPDDSYVGVNAYDKEQLNGSWLSDFGIEDMLQDPVGDEFSIGLADEPVAFSSQVPTTSRKRRASLTPLEARKKD
jgi:hypothetical protein